MDASLRPEQIQPRGDDRPINPDRVEQLADSISNVDLQSRIVVRPAAPPNTGIGATATQSSDSSLEVAPDSPRTQISPLDAPKVVNRNESSDGYSRVVAILNGKWRVIECRDRIQWILQSRDSLTPEVGLWRGRSYCRTKEALLRVCAAHAGKIDPAAAAILAGLSDWIEALNLVSPPSTTHGAAEEHR